MALTKCLECQKDMSNTLEACPHCGFKRVQLQQPTTNENNNFCSQCGMPYGKEKIECPHCNAKNLTAQANDKFILKVDGNNTICLSCGTTYYKGAGKCPYCKMENTNNTSVQAPDVHITDSNPNNTICTGCGKTYYKGVNKCPYCKVKNENKKGSYGLQIVLATIFAFMCYAVFYFAQNPVTSSNSITNVNIPDNNLKKIYNIGDIGPAGGFIFFDKGNSSGGWRYLEAAPEDQSTEIRWYNGENIRTGATGIKIGTGQSNTKKIISSHGNGIYAAKVCTDYYGGGKTDWFLPSKDELKLMYKTLYKNSIGGLTDADYWTSTEINFERACYIYFKDGYLDEGLKDYDKETHVRAIRSF